MIQINNTVNNNRTIADVNDSDHIRYTVSKARKTLQSMSTGNLSAKQSRQLESVFALLNEAAERSEELNNRMGETVCAMMDQH